MKPTTKTSIRSYWISCVADPPTMPEDALAAEKPSFNRGPDGRTPFGDGAAWVGAQGASLRSRLRAAEAQALEEDHVVHHKRPTPRLGVH